MRICENCKAVYLEVTIPKSRREDVHNGKYCPSYKWRCHLGYNIYVIFGVRVHFGCCPRPLTLYRLNKELRKRGRREYWGRHRPFTGIKFRLIDD